MDSRLICRQLRADDFRINNDIAHRMRDSVGSTSVALRAMTRTTRHFHPTTLPINQGLLEATSNSPTSF